MRPIALAAATALALTPLGASAWAVESARHPMSAASASGTAAPSSGIVRVKRKYGQRPVATKVGQRYAFVFEGRRGDRVRVSGGQFHWYARGEQRLLDQRGRRVVVKADGFATLPRKGTYRLRFVSTTPKAQLVKLRTVLARPGGVTTVKARQGIQHAVRVRTPAGAVRRVTVDGPLGVAMVAGRRVALDNRYDRPTDLFLVPRRPVISSEADQEWWQTKVGTGRQIRVLLDENDGGRIHVRRLSRVTVPVDGGPVGVPRAGAAISVAATVADQLPGRLLDVGLDEGWRVIGVAPAREVGVSGRLNSGNGLVSPASQGRSTLVVWPVSAPGGQAEVSLSSLTLHDAPVTLDGPGVTIPAPLDGRRALVPVQGTTPGDLMNLVVSESPATPWLVVAGDLTTSPHPHGCNGCGEHDSVSTSTPGVTARSFRGGPDKWVLVGSSGAEAGAKFGLSIVTAE